MYPTHLNGLSERRIEGLSREEICRKYQRKILLLSRRISERLPPGCELGGEDLASFGAIGLLEARASKPAAVVKDGAGAAPAAASATESSKLLKK